MKAPDADRLADRLGAALQRAADPKTKVWFEGYLRHAIAYRGVKTPAIRRVLAAWYRAEDIKVLAPKMQLVLADTLLRRPMAEDKFAGMMMVQRYVLDRVSLRAVLDMAERLYADGAFFDWSTTDWFCVRVLGPVLKRGYGAERIAGWRHSTILWQRRSAIVPFRAVLHDASYDALIAQTVVHLAQSDQRFIQTGVGWVLADLSKVRPRAAERMVEDCFDLLSAEVIRRHTTRLPKHREYRLRKRSA